MIFSMWSADILRFLSVFFGSKLHELALGFDIGDYLKEIGSEASVEDLVVRDLFDVSVTGAAAESDSVTVRFNLGLSQSATLIVLHNYEGSNWEIIPKDRVKQNADGTVDVTFDSFSPVAFVVDKQETADRTCPRDP